MSASVLDQAQNVRGVVSAARFRDRMVRKEANATDEGKRRLYREALFDVEERFPDLKQIPPGGAEAFARDRGHGKGARSPVHDGRSRPRSSKPATAKSSARSRRDAPPAKPKPAARKPSSAGSRRATSRPAIRRASTAPTPRVDRAIRQTGIPQALEGTGSTSMALLGATVGLSLAFLVLHSAEVPGSGVQAVPTAMKGLGRGLRRFLSPEQDIFPGGGPGLGEGEGRFEGSVPGSKEVREHQGRVPQPGVPEGARTGATRRHRERERRHQAELRRKGPGGVHR